MLAMRLFTAADIPFGLRLCRQAGWNQTEADWRRFLARQPDGCFVAERDGIPCGTTVTCILGPVAWVAMVLVDESVRGQGIGRALMTHALSFLDGHGVASVRLDATPLGQPLYERLGFMEQYRLARCEGTAPATPEIPQVQTATREQWAALTELDRVVTGAERRQVLLRLFAENPDGVRLVGDPVLGFLASRHGANAVQLGPCIASPETGSLLLTDAFRRHAGRRVFLDVPLTNETACRFPEAHGLTVQRHLTRMCRGVPSCERVEWLWASSGPEKG